MERVERLLGAEAERFRSLVLPGAPDPDAAAGLRAAGPIWSRRGGRRRGPARAAPAVAGRAGAAAQAPGGAVGLADPSERPRVVRTGRVSAEPRRPSAMSARVVDPPAGRSVHARSRDPGAGCDPAAAVVAAHPRSRTGWPRWTRWSSSAAAGWTRRWWTRPPGLPGKAGAAAAAGRRAHRGGAGRGHRQRQVVAGQRAGRGSGSARSACAGRPPPRPPRWSGAPTAPASCWTGCRCRAGTRPVSRRRTRPTGWSLLDLPDFDSVRLEHRLEVDRLVELVDLLVWVLDPQKYADAALHDRYLRPLAGHADVTLVVLNQSDRLDAAALEACLADLRRLLAADGLPRGAGARAYPRSPARACRRCREALASRAAARKAVGAAAGGGPGPDRGGAAAGLPGRRAGPAIRKQDRAALVDALTDAAGADTIAAAVDRAHRARAAAATGWPFTRWVRKLRPDPMRRLRLPETPSEAVRTGLPGPSAVQRARVDTALRQLTDRATEGLPEPWPGVVRRAATGATAGPARPAGPYGGRHRPRRRAGGRGGSCRSGSCRPCSPWRRWPGGLAAGAAGAGLAAVSRAPAAARGPGARCRRCCWSAGRWPGCCSRCWPVGSPRSVGGAGPARRGAGSAAGSRRSRRRRVLAPVEEELSVHTRLCAAVGRLG